MYNVNTYTKNNNNNTNALQQYQMLLDWPQTESGKEMLCGNFHSTIRIPYQKIELVAAERFK